MNVLQFNYQLDVGGQEAHVRDLCNYQAQLGHRVMLGSKGGDYEDELKGCDHWRIPFDELAPWTAQKLDCADYRCALRQFRCELERVVCERHIDLIHTHGVTETVLVRSALQHHPVPLLYSSHGWPLDEWPWHMRYLSGCDHYIAVSKFTRDKLCESGISACRISQIPYGITYQSEPDNATVQAIRSQLLSGSARDRIVITVARLHQQKGHDVLLRAIAMLRKKIDRAVFVFVGDGPERSHLEQLVEQNRLSNVVNLVGLQRDIVPYLHAADIFCLPSRYEALPLSIPEAYRAGLPVIACDVAGCAEIVRNGSTGYLVPPENPAAVVEVLLCLLRDDQLHQTMTRQAREYGFDRRFDPDQVHGEITALSEQLINQPPSRQSLTEFERTLAQAMAD